MYIEIDLKYHFENLLNDSLEIIYLIKDYQWNFKLIMLIMYIDDKQIIFFKLICFFYTNKYILLNLLNLEYYKIIYCENKYSIIIF